MNKKFSTLVASLLLAGAWTTANADIVEASLKIGGTYDWIGTAVEGNTVKNAWQYPVTPAEVKNQEAKCPFTLEAVKDVEGQFYIVYSGLRLKAAAQDLTDYKGTWVVWEGEESATEPAIKFKFEN